ncbi:Rossmann-like and DUF2520 domain-containing protein [Legionella worsleiensis]|uniref:Rossmann-like domain protein n=1 Tax=Legionella worsleiensis TaxID=45076 RepID=A0A0W1AEJ4_9GAMM|nr:DUF2520 domain-containing protein [Legionella worsleiensis]KTD79704.1 Rossmann-like domain protein [Legionella worsleiensis]STY32215.1 Uncharacterized conserved protein [Legionella worsleiensis]
MNYNIIGAGRLGKNIALALSVHQQINLNSICNRRYDTAIQACHEIGQGKAVKTITQLPQSDVTWITCNDDAIESVVYQLLCDAVLKPGSFIIHCSGALNSTLLHPLKELGCSVASFHPLKAFKSGYLDPAAFREIYCVAEGDDLVCKWLHQIFQPLGAQVLSIQPDEKTKYHAAAAIASNYLITLAHASEELLLQAGIAQTHARTMICNLMQGNINNLLHTQRIEETLTGPLCRGDTQTLNMHLKAINNPKTQALYKTAGLATLAMTDLPEETQIRIEELLHY